MSATVIRSLYDAMGSMDLAALAASFQLLSSEVFGDGERIVGEFTATLTALASGETMAMKQAELYRVKDSLISHVEVFQNNTPELIKLFARNGPAL